MRKHHPFLWKNVSYSNMNKEVPEERWGHRFVRVSHSEIVMFGGYGSSLQTGKYFDDLWTYNIRQNYWQKVVTSGQTPEARSNYTLHFNQHTNEMIMFGGGTDQKMRFNDVCILNWQTKTWRIIHPNQSSAGPWERTYHSSEFVYPYLIVFGGQSLSCMDTNDMWVFNIQTEQWKQLQFKEEENKPCPRRFHSSALIDGYFYVIAGCHGIRYNLLGDIYRVDLKQLIQRQSYTSFEWECVLNNNHKFQRWGHSSDVYNQCIYISCGRHNSTEDSSDIFVFDHNTLRLSEYNTVESSKPKPRRKHSSIIIGNALLIYGGYSGKYLPDFDYIVLQSLPQGQQQPLKVIPTDTIEESQKQLSKMQKELIHDITLRVVSESKEALKLKSNEQLLKNNPFFKLLIRNSEEEQITVYLPPFSDILAFRTIHAAITAKAFPLPNNTKLRNYTSLIRSAEYFCCNEIYQPIENILSQQLSENNCERIYRLAADLQLEALKQSAAKLLFISREKWQRVSFQPSLKGESYCSKDLKQKGGNESAQYLCDLYHKLQFDIEQKRLQESEKSVFSRTFSKIKNFFSSNTTQATLETASTQGQQQRKGDCLSSFAQFVSRICRKSKVEVEDNEAQ